MASLQSHRRSPEEHSNLRIMPLAHDAGVVSTRRCDRIYDPGLRAFVLGGAAGVDIDMMRRCRYRVCEPNQNGAHSQVTTGDTRVEDPTWVWAWLRRLAV